MLGSCTRLESERILKGPGVQFPCHPHMKNKRLNSLYSLSYFLDNIEIGSKFKHFNVEKQVVGFYCQK